MKIKQTKMNLYQGKRGGRRPGAGRKKQHSPGVRHIKREKVNKHKPLHINFKVVKHLPNLRNKFILKCLKKAVLKARLKGLKITHFSLQSNHVHLIIEVQDNKGLEKGMKSLNISFAKRLNGVFKRQGQVLKERFHLHVLKCPKETRNAIDYVLHNQQKHTGIKHEDPYTQTSLLDIPGSWLLRRALGLMAA